LFKFRRQQIDEDTRLYHSRTKLTNKRIEAASKGTPPLESEEMMGVGISMGMAGTVIDPNAPIENPILEMALEIEGVESAAVTPYTLLIKKAQQFSWEEIEKSIIKLFTTVHLPLEESKIKDN